MLGQVASYTGEASDSHLFFFFFWQEPVLCWPYRYMRVIGPIPTEARPLRVVKAAKKSDYLALSQLLIAKAPTESSARSVTFLVPCQHW